MMDGNDCGAIGGMNECQGRPKCCPSAALSTTNPTLLEQDSNKRRRGEKPAINRLTSGTAK
jgi:hypothetical protein